MKKPQDNFSEKEITEKPFSILSGNHFLTELCSQFRFFRDLIWKITEDYISIEDRLVMS